MILKVKEGAPNSIGIFHKVYSLFLEGFHKIFRLLFWKNIGELRMNKGFFGKIRT